MGEDGPTALGVVVLAKGYADSKKRWIKCPRGVLLDCNVLVSAFVV